MGKVKLFPTPEYTSKQPRDSVVPRVHGWRPVKEFIEKDMGVNTEREQVYFDKWDEGALRTIIQQQKKVTRTSKQLGLKRLYQVLIICDDFADQPELHRRTGDGALDTLFIRGRHMQISTWVSSQKLRLIRAAVRVNMQFICIWRLRNQLELEAVLEELSALLPKQELLQMYQEAMREPYSFWFIHYLKDKANMFYKRWEERFVLDGAAEPAEAAEPQQPVNGRLPVGGGQQAAGGGPIIESECSNIRCCSSSSQPNVHDPRLATLPTGWGQQGVSGESTASGLSRTPFRFRRNKPAMTTIYVDSRNRVSGSDSNFTFELPETLHMQTSAKMAVYKVRIADAFLSTDRGTHLYWIDVALGTLNTAELPVGAYTGARLAAWISSNFAAATYVEATNAIEVAYDSNRRILSDAELRDLFPNGPGYPQGASATRPQSNHLLGGSYLDGALQIFPWVSMNAYNEVYLRCRELGNAAHILGPLGTDIICKVIVDRGVGHVMKDQTDDGHFVELRGPITLRSLNFRLTDVNGNEVNTRGTSVSFAIFLDPEK